MSDHAVPISQPPTANRQPPTANRQPPTANRQTDLFGPDTRIAQTASYSPIVSAQPQPTKDNNKLVFLLSLPQHVDHIRRIAGTIRSVQTVGDSANVKA